MFPRFCLSAVEERELLALAFVALFRLGADGFVVAGEGLEGVVGQAVGEDARGGAEEAVAALDVVIEEGERFAGLGGFEPKGDFAQLDGHGIHVHAVEAVADDFAQGVAELVGRRLFVAGAEDGEPSREAMASGDEEVP